MPKPGWEQGRAAEDVWQTSGMSLNTKQSRTEEMERTTLDRSLGLRRSSTSNIFGYACSNMIHCEFAYVTAKAALALRGPRMNGKHTPDETFQRTRSDAASTI